MHQLCLVFANMARYYDGEELKIGLCFPSDVHTCTHTQMEDQC